jgi:hypothetical protein
MPRGPEAGYAGRAGLGVKAVMGRSWLHRPFEPLALRYGQRCTFA